MPVLSFNGSKNELNHGISTLS